MNKYKNIIKEEIQEFLNETTAIDVWNKFYKNIKKDDFYKIIAADPTTNLEKDRMGKYSKWLLTLYKKNKLLLEDLYKATDYLKLFIKYKNILDEKNIMKYQSLPHLYKELEKATTEIKSDAKIFTKQKAASFIKKGDAEIFYEDSDWLVIIPKTMEASQYFGLKTDWCTSSEDESRNVFDQYHLQDGKHELYIFINKENNKDKYQLYLGHPTQFKDRYDDEHYVDRIIDEDLFKTILKKEGIEYKKFDPSKRDYETLIEIIEEFYCDGYHRDAISKESIIEFLDGNWHSDIWYPELGVQELEYYIEERHIEKIFNHLLQESKDSDVKEFYDKYINNSDITERDVLEYLEEEHNDLFHDLRSIYFRGADTQYSNEFYKAILKEIDNFNLNEYTYNIRQFDLLTYDDNECISVYEPHYGFDSSPDQQTFDEYFNEEF